MWIPIGWNFVFVALNLYHIAVIVYEKRPVQMSPKHKELYETMFKDLTPVEFLKITKLADWEHFKSGEVIIQERHAVETLNLIYNGTVDVAVDGKKVAQLKDGQFVGEMSFLTEKPATATCVVKHDAELLVWRQREFKELLKRNPSLYYSIQSLLSTQLVSISSK
jgi:signal-transduction protein with cAMP-binding, CBS, and nucleotidyltransferase domain